MSNPFTWLSDQLTGFDRDEYERGIEADNRNRAITEDLKTRGLISEDDYDFAIKNYNDAASYDPDHDIGAAFGQGIDDGAANIRNLAGGTVNALALTPLKLIPWQVWLALAIYAAFKFGLLNGLVKRWR